MSALESPSPPMASLGDLPLEIFGLIVRVLDARGCDWTLAAMAATCRRFYEIVMPHLYHDAASRHPALLHWAAHYGRVSTAKRLIDEGAPVDAAMRWNYARGDFKSLSEQRTPRQLYRSFRAYVIGRRIVITKKINIQTPFWFPIHLAALSGSVEMVELLVKAAPETISAPSSRLCGCCAEGLPAQSQEKSDPDWCLPLHTAACHGHLDVARWLLEHGCEPEATVKPPATADFRHVATSSTILHDAARLGQVDLIKLILDGGYLTNIHELDDRQLSPIWHAYFLGQLQAVAELVARGADIDDDLGYGYTPLVDACLRRDLVGVVELVDLGANVNIEFHAAPHNLRKVPGIQCLEGSGIRPIDICCGRHLTKPERPSLELVPDEESQTWRPCHPQEWEREENQRLVAVSKLLGAGAHLNGGARGHPPPLVVASANHLSGIVHELIKHGAPVNLADRDGVSPLAAAFAYYISCCPFHLSVKDEMQENLNMRDKLPFFTDILSRVRIHLRKAHPGQGGCSELRACVGLLLQNGADANLADINGNSPLCRLFTAPCFRPLLGARHETSLWITPLDRHRITSLLVQHGADPEGRMNPSKEWIEANKKRARRSKGAERRWPLTAMEHAFWDADFESCQRLLEAGAAPSKEVVVWMIQLVLKNDVGHSRRTTDALQFIKRLPAELRCGALRSPLCLALALHEGRLELAQEIWSLGPELSQFSEKLRADSLVLPIPPLDDDKYVELGTLCLNAAVRVGATSILEGLLELGVRPILSSTVLHALSVSNDMRILKALVEHGAKIHTRDQETDDDKVHWLEFAKCINPMKLAIRESNHPAIKTMLNCSPDPIDPWFRYFYLKEACTLLNPITIACLLEHSSMRFDEADITDETDLPLAHLVRNVERICSRPGRPAVEYGPQARMDAVGAWIDCIAAFAQAGVDPTMRDRAGKSALDYVEEHLAYEGTNRFRNHLAVVLRLDGGLDPEHELGLAGAFYEALKSIEIRRETTEMTATSPSDSR